MTFVVSSDRILGGVGGVWWVCWRIGGIWSGPKMGCNMALATLTPNIQIYKHANMQIHRNTNRHTQTHKYSNVQKYEKMGCNTALATLLTPAYRQHPLPPSCTIVKLFSLGLKLFSLRQNYFNFNFCLFGLKLLFRWIKTIVFLTQNYCLALNYCLLGSKQDCTIKWIFKQNMGVFFRSRSEKSYFTAGQALSEVFPYLPSTDTFCGNLGRKSIQGATFDSGTEIHFWRSIWGLPCVASCTRSLCYMWSWTEGW